MSPLLRLAVSSAHSRGAAAALGQRVHAHSSWAGTAVRTAGRLWSQIVQNWRDPITEHHDAHKLLHAFRSGEDLSGWKVVADQVSPPTPHPPQSATPLQAVR